MSPRAGDGADSVVVVGSINADIHVRVDRRPRPGETVGNGDVEFRPGGKGANQAAAAARCGASVTMVGRIGRDSFGDAQRVALADDAVDVSAVSVSDDGTTGLAIVVVTPDGENSIIVAPGTNHQLAPEHIDAASSVLGGAAVLVSQLEIPIETVGRAFEVAGSQTQVVLNCAPFSPLSESVLARTTVLVANELEAAAITGRAVATPDDALVAAHRVIDRGPRWAVITLGHLGAVVAGHGLAAVHVPAESVAVVDTTGSGDAFVGALAAALSKGRDVVQAARLGVVVGSATATHLGARALVPPGFAL